MAIYQLLKTSGLSIFCRLISFGKFWHSYQIEKFSCIGKEREESLQVFHCFIPQQTLFYDLSLQFFINLLAIMSYSSERSKSRVTLTQIQEISEPPKELFQSGFQQRYWLRNHGKEEHITFTDKALLELRKYFESLDQTGTGSIGVEQLEDPFIAFGLSENRDEVADLIKTVDLDGSGTIQFNQFLEIMNNIKRGKANENTKNSAIVDFFKKLSSGNLQQFDKSMNFRLNVSQYRRKRLLDSIMSGDKDKKDKGSKIMQNFKKQVVANNNLKEILSQSKKSSIFINGFDVKTQKKGNSK